MAPRRSRRGMPPKAAKSLALSRVCLGQNKPPHCPTRCPQFGEADPLGVPLGINEAAAIIGCSAWSVRQKYLPMGLPHFRVGLTGKLIFYKNQLICWLIDQQRKGGIF